MKAAREAMLDALENIEKQRDEEGSFPTTDSIDIAVVSAGFVMLGERLDQIIELLEENGGF